MEQNTQIPRKETFSAGDEITLEITRWGAREKTSATPYDYRDILGEVTVVIKEVSVPVYGVLERTSVPQITIPSQDISVPCGLKKA